MEREEKLIKPLRKFKFVLINSPRTGVDFMSVETTLFEGRNSAIQTMTKMMGVEHYSGCDITANNETYVVISCPAHNVMTTYSLYYNNVGLLKGPLAIVKKNVKRQLRSLTYEDIKYLNECFQGGALWI